MQTRSDMFSRLGRWFLIRFTALFEICALLGRAAGNVLPAARHGQAAILRVLFRQVYFTGLEASGIVVTIAAILGVVVISQVVSLVGTNGSMAGKILVWVVMRELAPLLTAIIVVARSGTAIAAELGSMRINGEIDSIELLGIPSERYLILPRIAGVTLSVVVLTCYFVLTSCIASFLIASVGWHIPYQQFVQGITLSLGVPEVVILLAKSLAFGLFVSVICCWYGLGVGRSATEIPQAATKAVMGSLFAVFFLDGLITYLGSLLLS